MTQKDVLLAWMNDACAMEEAQIQTLTDHLRDAQDLPMLRDKLQEHLEATRRHADTIRDGIQRLGGTVSGLKAVAGTAPGFFQNLSSGMLRDQLVRNVLVDYGVESFEIICYRALAEAADAAEQDDLVPVFERILDEEEDMAAWLEQNLPLVIEEYMNDHADA